MELTKRFTILNGAALLVGVIAGLAAVAFRALINIVEHTFFNATLPATFDEAVQESGVFLQSKWGLLVFLVPAVGGLVVGGIRAMIPQASRQGVPEVLAAVQARGGIIRGRTAWGHALISAVTVGSGGSTGREGPIAYIGAALGSSIGRRAGFGSRDIKVLLGCGTSAGIAATFNAPLGGVLFSLEIILPEFSTHAFIPLVLSTVVGVTISQMMLGDQPAFQVPDFSFGHPMELGFHMVLGILCGLGGVFFIKAMSRTQDLSERLPIPLWLKPASGGLVVGLLGLLVYQLTARGWLGGQSNYHVYGTGYATVNALLSNEALMLNVGLLALLIVAKPLASAVTLGSGGGGGVFSASLFQGALYGGLMGVVVNRLWPTIASAPSNYVLVGMGAFYAASGRATLTTIVLMSEMTNGYDIVLPLMFAAVTADLVSVSLSRDSIYTTRLRKRGISYDHDRMQSALDVVRVGNVMTPEVDRLSQDMPVGEAWAAMLDMGHNGFPVVDEEDLLVGVVTRRDLSRALHDGHGEKPLKEVVSGLSVTAYPHELLHLARDRLFTQDIGRLIVIDPEDRRRILGIVTRSDIMRAEAEHDIEITDAWKQ